MMIENSQDLLWFIPAKVGSAWWLVCSAFSFVGAFLNFLYLIMNQKFSSVVLARSIMCAGLFMLGLVPLNSGCLPWATMLLAIGGAYNYFLIATNWCERSDKWSIVVARFTRSRTKHGPEDVPARHR